jgi:hypothetical protein
MLFATGAFAQHTVGNNSYLGKEPIRENCTLKGIPLYGRVQVVSIAADFKVCEVVKSAANLYVKKVSTFPTSCGEWQFVDNNPDFTIQFVPASAADFYIYFDNSFPGLPPTLYSK